MPYKDRNYLVYKGRSISEKELIKVISSPYFRYDEEQTLSYAKNDIKILRNNYGGDFQDFNDYKIHHYKNYAYLFDFDINSLMMQYEGEPLECDMDEDILPELCGGYNDVKDIFRFAELNGDNYYELLPKLLYNSNDSDLAYLLLKYYAPDNLSYVIADKETNNIQAITIKNQRLNNINYDGLYFTKINDDEQLLSNNKELLEEFSNQVKKLSDNSVYKNGKVKKLRWKK